MKPKIPPHGSTVQGFSVQVRAFEENPAQNEEEQVLLRPGYLVVRVSCDGRNPFFPNRGYWKTMIVTAKTTQPLHFIDPVDFTLISLAPNEVLHSIRVAEANVKDHGPGVWTFVTYRIQGREQLFGHVFPVVRYGST